MKKKVLTIICIVSIVCVAVLLCGCGGSSAAKYDHLVTFDYNTAGLEWGDTPAPAAQYLGTMDGKRIMAPVSEYRSDGSENENYKNAKFQERNTGNYTVMGWYLPQTDEDGNVRKDENGSVLLGERWDFSTGVVTQDVTLYAMLKMQRILQLEVDGKITVTKHYGEGRSITRTNFMTRLPTKDGYTFCDFYYDKACTQRFTFPYVMESEDRTIYPKFIEGTWKVISTADDLQEVLFNRDSAYKDVNWYFNAEEIDCSSLTGLGRLYANRTFAAELNGNGCVIKNLSYTIRPRSINNQEGFGLFGILRSSAYIHDLSFENVQVTATVGTVAHIGGVFVHTAESGARLSNVTMQGSVTRASGCNSALQIIAFDNGVTQTNCTFTVSGM